MHHRTNAVCGLFAATLYVLTSRYPLVAGVFVNFGIACAGGYMVDMLRARVARARNPEGKE